MGDSEQINQTVETIDMLIFSAIEQLKKSKKRSDEHAILESLQRKMKHKPTNIITKYSFPQ